MRTRFLHKYISNLSLRARREHMMFMDKIGVKGTHAFRALYEILQVRRSTMDRSLRVNMTERHMGRVYSRGPAWAYRLHGSDVLRDTPTDASCCIPSEAL